MEVTGILKLVKDTQKVSEKFSKREFVIETLEQYPQTLQFELQGQNCDIIDAYAVGQEVVCQLNLRGREWVNKEGKTVYFNTLVCWKMQPSQGETQPKPEPKSSNKKQELTQPLGQDNEPDDLPF